MPADAGLGAVTVTASGYGRTTRPTVEVPVFPPLSVTEHVCANVWFETVELLKAWLKDGVVATVAPEGPVHAYV